MRRAYVTPLFSSLQTISVQQSMYARRGKTRGSAANVLLPRALHRVSLVERYPSGVCYYPLRHNAFAFTFPSLPSRRLLMRRTLRVILVIVAVLIVLVLVAPFLIPVNQFRPTIEEKASAALGRKVDVGNLSLSLFSGSLAADNLVIADDPKFSKSPFLTAKSIKVGVELLALILHKDLNITAIVIDSPEVTLIRSAAGEWNYSSFGAAAAKSQGKPAPPSSQ